MSATLDPGPVAEYLEGGAVRTIAAPLHPIETCYALQRRRGPLEQSVAATVRRALVEAPQQGDVLVFLPGMSEIRRVAETLAPTMEVEVLALHGSLPGPQQDRALRRSDRRRIVLATNVAETSVTVEGVTSVVDSGLMRLPRFDPARGINQLELTHISRASADQRAGRAGRLGPGRAYRLWTESEHASLAAHTPPEVRRVDLARVVLELRAWGADPEQFDWFEAPEPSALQRAAEFLRRIGALDRATGAVTSTGRALLDLPLHPRLAQLLLSACAHGYPRSGATLAALLGERDILRGGEHSADLPTARSDLLIRMELLDLAEQNQFRSTPQLWADVDLRAAREVARVRDDLYQAVSDAPQRSRSSSRARSSSGSETEPSESALLSLILTAYPDRVVRRREAGSTRGLMVGGRGVMLDRRSVVREEQFFIALVIDRGGRDARVRLASGIDREWLRTRDEHTCRFDPTSERVVAQRKLMFDDLCLSAHPCAPDPSRRASSSWVGPPRIRSPA
jgi:ATP-dependent helicase HrpB